MTEIAQRSFNDRWSELKSLIAANGFREPTVRFALKRLTDEQNPETSTIIRKKLLMILMKASSSLLDKSSLMDLFSSGALTNGEIIKLFRTFRRRKLYDVCDAIMEILPPYLFRRCLFHHPPYLRRWIESNFATCVVNDYLKTRWCWRKLALWHPDLAASLLEAQIISSRPKCLFVNESIDIIAINDGESAIKLLSMYISKFDSFGEFDFSKVARRSPTAFVQWLLTLPIGSNFTRLPPSRINFDMGGQEHIEWMNSLVPWDLHHLLTRKGFVRRLPPHLRVISAGIDQKFVSLLSPELREEFTQRYINKSMKESGFVSSEVLEKLPLARRVDEARRILREETIGKGDIEKWWFVASLPYEEALPIIKENLRHPLSDVRGGVFDALGKVTRAEGGSHVDFLLDQAINSVNDQDPVRCRILDALLSQKIDRLSREQLEKIILYGLKTNDQIDLSYTSCYSLSILLWRIWPFLPDETVKLHIRLGTHNTYQGTFKGPSIPLSAINDEAWDALNRYLLHRFKEQFATFDGHYIGEILKYIGKYTYKLTPTLKYIFSSEGFKKLEAEEWKGQQIIKTILRALRRYDKKLYRQLRTQLLERDLSWIDESGIARYCARKRPDLIARFVANDFRASGLHHKSDSQFCLRLNASGDFVEWDLETQQKYAKFLIQLMLCEVAQTEEYRVYCFRAWLIQLASIPTLHPQTLFQTLKWLLEDRVENNAWPVEWLKDLFCESLSRVDDWRLAWESVASLFSEDPDLIQVAQTAMYYLLPRLSRREGAQRARWILDNLRREEDKTSVQPRLACLCTIFDSTTSLRDTLRAMSEKPQTKFKSKILYLRHTSCEDLIGYLSNNVTQMHMNNVPTISHIRLAEIASLYQRAPNVTHLEELYSRYKDLLSQWLVTVNSLNIMSTLLKREQVWICLTAAQSIEILCGWGRRIVATIVQVRERSRKEDSEDGLEATAPHVSTVPDQTQEEREEGKLLASHNQAKDGEADDSHIREEATSLSKSTEESVDSYTRSRRLSEHLSVAKESFELVITRLCSHETLSQAASTTGLMRLVLETFDADLEVRDTILSKVHGNCKAEVDRRDAICQALIKQYIGHPDSLAPLTDVLMALGSNERLAKLILDRQTHMDENIYYIYEAAAKYPYDRSSVVRQLLDWIKINDSDERINRISLIVLRLICATVAKEVGWTAELRKLLAACKAPDSPSMMRAFARTIK